MTESRHIHVSEEGQDRIWSLSQEITRAVDVILRSFHSLPLDKRLSTLRAARELLSAQSLILDHATAVPGAPSANAGGHPGLESALQSLLEGLNENQSAPSESGPVVPPAGAWQPPVHRPHLQSAPAHAAMPVMSQEFDRVALALEQQLTHLSPAIAEHAAESAPTLSDPRATFTAILQGGRTEAVATPARPQMLRRPARGSGAVKSTETDEVDDDTDEHDAETAESHRSRPIGLTKGRIPGASFFKWGIAAMAVAGAIVWFEAPGRSVKSLPQTPSADAQGIESAEVGPTTAPSSEATAASGEATTHDEAAAETSPDKLQSRLPPSIPGEPEEKSPVEMRSPEEAPSPHAPNLPEPPTVASTLSDADLAAPQVSTPRAPQESPTAAPSDSQAQRSLSNPSTEPVSGEPSTSPIREAQPIPAARPKNQTKAVNDEDATPAPVKEPSPKTRQLPASAAKPASAPKSPQAWQTASIPPVVGHFTPVLVSVKEKAAALQIFADLKKRHAALANKTAELKPFAGPDGETWYHVAAVPAVSEGEAKATCEALGPEGLALDCTAAPY